MCFCLQVSEPQFALPESMPQFTSSLSHREKSMDSVEKLLSQMSEEDAIAFIRKYAASQTTTNEVERYERGDWSSSDKTTAHFPLEEKDGSVEDNGTYMYMSTPV